MRKKTMKFLTIGLAFVMMLQISPNNVSSAGSDPQRIIKEAVDFTFFAASHDSAVTINSAKVNIKGDVHSNTDFVFRGSNLLIEGTCESSGRIDVICPITVITDTVENGPVIEMPDYIEQIKAKAKANNGAETFEGDKGYYGSSIIIPKSVLSTGSVSVNGSTLISNGYIIAKNNISFNMYQMETDTEKGIVICSENGNITFNGSSFKIKGIIYVPNGTVIINSANFDLYGKIIADKIIFRGSSLNITSNDEVNDLIRDEKDVIGKVAPLKKEDIVTDEETGFEVVKNQILIVFKEETSKSVVDFVVNSIGGKIVGYIEEMNDYQIEIEGDYDLSYIKQLIQQLNNNEHIEFATLNMLIGATEAIPDDRNDPEWFKGFLNNDTWDESNPKGRNWGLEAIYAPSAWDYNNRMSSIKIGILDGAIKYNHEDLDIPESNYKYSATGQSDINKTKSHATNVAGIIGAISNNNVGVTGIVWNRELYVYAPEFTVTWQDDLPKIQLFEFKYGILWLLSNGCKVINMSQGLSNMIDINQLQNVLNNNVTQDFINTYIENPKKYWTPFMKRLINNGYDFVFIQSAGNRDIDAKYGGFMCSIEDEEVKERVIVVGAIQNNVSWGKHRNFSKANFSNYGDKVDIIAPGDDIFSTATDESIDPFTGEISDPNTEDSYTSNDGTSLAAPHVTGIAAMVWAANPGLTGRQIKRIVVDTADRPVTFKDNNGQSRLFGNIVNANLAVERALSEQAEVPLPRKEYGILVGRVSDAVTGEDISDATVLIHKNGISSGSGYYSATSTYEDGSYEQYLEPGDYTILIEKDGYFSDYLYIHTDAGITTYNPTLRAVSTAHGGEGIVTGVIRNALDGSGVEGLAIKFRKGINAISGSIVKQTTTGPLGVYSIELEAGSYTGEISGDGYITGYFYVVSVGGELSNAQNGIASPVISDGQTRIILSWGQYPSDLDSHLTGPSTEGRFHVYYANKSYYENEVSHVQLDRDDTDSYGPETTTIDIQKDGVYRFSVHDYTNRNSIDSKDLSLSGAEIRVLRGSSLIAVFSIPTNEGGTVWTVFEMEGNKITPINKLSYQSSPQGADNMRLQTPDSEGDINNNLEEDDTWIIINNLPEK